MATQHLLHKTLRRPQLESAAAAVGQRLRQARCRAVFGCQLIYSRLVTTAQSRKGFDNCLLLREVCRSQQCLRKPSMLGCSRDISSGQCTSEPAK